MNKYSDYEHVLQKQIEDLKTTDRHIILFGTMAMGRMAKKAIEYFNKKVSCFCDNDKNKWGTYINGIPVLSPEQVQKEYPDAKVYICSFKKNTFKEIKEQLQKLGYTDINNKDMLFYIYQLKVCNRGISSKNLAETMEDINESKLVIKSAGVLLTEICSLRCKNCASLVPYFKDPKHYDKDIIIKSIKSLSNSIDIIESVELVGGEALLHPNLLEICQQVSMLNNINRITVITNGTIIPCSEDLIKMRDLGVYFLISEYDKKISKMDDLIRIFDENDIVYEILKHSISWYRVLPPKKHNRTNEENKIMFNSCIWSKCNTIQNGIMIPCPYAGAAFQLGKIECNNDDYINLSDSSLSKSEIRYKVNKLLNNTESILACDYCSLDLNNVVPRAEQVKGILEI